MLTHPTSRSWELETLEPTPDVSLKIGMITETRLQLSPLQRNQPPSFKFTDGTLDDDDMLHDIRGYTAALYINIDIPVNCGDPHDESSQRGVSPGNGLFVGDTLEELVPSF